MLTIRNLTLTYPNGVKALADVSLTIPHGVFGLLGPNGAGKTSLMRTVATLQRPDSGHIDLDGVDALKHPDKVRQTLGYLPQDFLAYPELSGMALLRHVVALKLGINGKERDDWVESLLNRTNLWHARARKVGEYSGGMRQRLGVAQALVGSPAIIIADEPTAGLDPEERMRVLDLLAEAGERSSVVLSTHIVEDVASICSTMAVLNQGQVLQQINPATGIKTLQGRVWETSFPRTTKESFTRDLRILGSRLADGQVAMAVESASRPGEHFEAIPPTLGHLYFHILKAGKPSSQVSSAVSTSSPK